METALMPSELKPTVAYVPESAKNEHVPQIEMDIEMLINEQHGAAKDLSAKAGKAPLVKSLDPIIKSKLEQYAREEAVRDSVRAKWIIPVMYACWKEASGDLVASLAFAKESLDALDSLGADERIDLWTVKSLNNVSVGHRRVGEFEKAVDYAKRAYARRPQADWVLVTLVLAFYYAGDHEASDAVLAELAKTSSLAPESILGFHARHDEEFRRMDTPLTQTLVSLVAQMDGVNASSLPDS